MLIKEEAISGRSVDSEGSLDSEDGREARIAAMPGGQDPSPGLGHEASTARREAGEAPMWVAARWHV